ncbi:MAG: cupin domain-containing protein [Nocardiopsaceae bacterium]|nr:cupin domain-containing protein [Nocardiopsaceae bacterium]
MALPHLARSDDDERLTMRGGYTPVERMRMATPDKRIYVREVASGEYNLEEFRQQQLERARVRDSDLDIHGRPSTEHEEAESPAPWRLGPGDEDFLTQSVQVHFRNLRPGLKSGKHGHQNEAIFYILEGQGYDIDDEIRYEYSAGDTLIVNNDSVHQHFNASETEWCKILVLKAKSLYLMLGLVEQGREKSQPDESFGPREAWGGVWTEGVEDLKKVIRATDGEWVDDKRIGLIRRIVDKDEPGARCFSMDVFEQVVQPGESSVKHRHMADEVVYVISGEGESTQRDVRSDIDSKYYARVSKDERTLSIKAGDAVYVPHNCIHQFTNTGDQPLRLLSGQNRAFRHLGYESILA